MASALYLIGGVGSTKFLDQSNQTINFGLGYRVFLKDWAAIQVDFRDYIYTLDLLGQEQVHAEPRADGRRHLLLLSP